MGQYEALGQRIREARLTTGMNQTVFAQKIGIKGNHLSILERGDKRPSIQLARRIAEVTHLSYEWLRGEEELQNTRFLGASKDGPLENEGDVRELLRKLCSNIWPISDPVYSKDSFGTSVFGQPHKPRYWLYVHDSPIKYWAFEFCFTQIEEPLPSQQSRAIRGFERFLTYAAYFDDEHRLNAKYSFVVFDDDTFELFQNIPVPIGNLSIIQLDMERKCVVRERYLCLSPNATMVKALAGLQFEDALETEEVVKAAQDE